MGLFDILNAGKIKKENEGLREVLSPELQDAANLSIYVSDLESKREKLEKEVDKLSSKVSKLKEDAIFSRMQ